MSGRILVTDDDPWSRRIARDLLEMRGHEVFSATTGFTSYLSKPIDVASFGAAIEQRLVEAR